MLLILKLNESILSQTLEEKDRKVGSQRDTLLREQRYLRRRLELLSSQMDDIHKRRSLSESSATSTGSSNSHSSNSESGKETEKQLYQIFIIMYIFGTISTANIYVNEDNCACTAVYCSESSR